jgi:hypothetical protein
MQFARELITSATINTSVPKRPRTRGKPGAGRKFMDDTAGVGR